MKKFYTTVTVVFLVFVLSNVVFAQEGFKYGIGGELAMPMGDFGDMAEMGFGGTVIAEKVHKENMTLIATAGYLVFGGKDSDYYEYSFSAIPIQGGVKYFFNPKKEEGYNMYGLGLVGIHMWSITIKTKETDYDGWGRQWGDTSTEQETTNDETEMSFAGGVGAEKPMSNGKLLDGSVRYQIAGDNLAYLGIRVGMRF
jgi:hypothetical protein